MHERIFITNTKINPRLGSKALKTGSTFLQKLLLANGITTGPGFT